MMEKQSKSANGSTMKSSVTPVIPKKIPSPQKSGIFPIVGIGASAGGLEALEQFLRNVPESEMTLLEGIERLKGLH